MIRARFELASINSDPINRPIKHPYWIYQEDIDEFLIITYADSINYIYENWPNAKNIEYEKIDKYTFNTRYPKPNWFKGE